MLRVSLVRLAFAWGKFRKRLIAILRTLGNRQRRVTANTLTNRGKVYSSLGEHQKAIGFYHQALTLYRKMCDRADAAHSLYRLGTAYKSLGQYQQAIKYYKQTLITYQELGNHDREAYSLTNLGNIYDALGQYKQAIEYHQQALIAYQKLGDRSGEGGSLCNLGQAYYGLGQYQQALEYYQQALPILRAIGHRQFEANTLNSLGNVYKSLGQYHKALEYHQQALTIYREIGDRRREAVSLTSLGHTYHSLGQYQLAIESLQQARVIEGEIGMGFEGSSTLTNLALVYSSLGQYQKALEYHQQVLTINRDLGYRRGESGSLSNLGLVYSSLGQYQKALKYHQQALTFEREIGDRCGEGGSLCNLGSVYHSLGQYQQAINYYLQALPILQEIGHRQFEANTLGNLGLAYDSLKQHQKAIEFYQQVLTMQREMSDRRGEAASLSNLGLAYDSLGQHQKAIEHYQQSIEVRESIHSDLNIEELKISFVGEQIPIYERLIGLLLQDNCFKEAFNYVERSRARAFLDQFANGLCDFRTGASDRLLKQEQTIKNEITALRIQLVTLRNRPSNEWDTEAIATLQNQLITLEKDYTNLLTELKLQSPETASLVSVDVASLDEIQSLLDADTTLLEYFVTEERTLAFIITRNSFQTATLNVTQEDLTKKIEAFRRFASLKNPHPKSLQQLYEWLIAPLKPYLKTSQLAIVPHGVLHYLPFAALTDGNRYLSDNYTLTTLPSASILRFLPQKRKPSTDTLLALGNPTTTEPLPRLHFAEQEVYAIASLYNTQPLIGTAANESVVFSQAGNAEILHLAVHGEFNKHNPLFSTLYLAPDAEHDGRLEVHDIYTLDLTIATNLVALSACQTQLGELSKGDEIVGLNRAFLYAGTPSVIATLWSVNDKVTGILMERFYTHLRSGMTKAQSLRIAQMDVRIEHPHPYYWAAFVLTGDGGNI